MFTPLEKALKETLNHISLKLANEKSLIVIITKNEKDNIALMIKSA